MRRFDQHEVVTFASRFYCRYSRASNSVGCESPPTAVHALDGPHGTGLHIAGGIFRSSRRRDTHGPPVDRLACARCKLPGCAVGTSRVNRHEFPKSGQVSLIPALGARDAVPNPVSAQRIERERGRHAHRRSRCRPRLALAGTNHNELGAGRAAREPREPREPRALRPLCPPLGLEAPEPQSPRTPEPQSPSASSDGAAPLPSARFPRGQEAPRKARKAAASGLTRRETNPPTH